MSKEEQTRFSFDVRGAGWEKTPTGIRYVIPKSSLKPCVCHGYALAELEQRIKNLEERLSCVGEAEKP